MDKKVFIAMSGGVDSTVAAFLLQQAGYDCEGVTLRLGSPAVSAVDEARRAAERMGIPLHVLDAAEAFDREVIRQFAEGYLNGQTPNPCVQCNRHIKFGALLDFALRQGGALATGHYARMKRDGGSGKFLLKKAVDLTKDQSYMLYVLPREALSEILFPLGGLTKAEVREIARINGFDNADKKESQDICFIPDGNHAAFIERYTGRFCAPGDFVDTQGNILGRHGGITRYTVGQRKGLGIALQKPVFVREKDAKTNRVVLCESGELFSKSLEAGDFNWLVPETPASFRASARVRYHQAERPCSVTVVSKDTVRIDFDEPQRAIAMGQAVVLYDGDTVLGGGTIK